MTAPVRHAGSVLRVIAVDDRARQDRNAVELGRRLVAGTTVQLEIVVLEPRGDRRAAIRDRLAHRNGAIVIMDVHGGGFEGDLLFDEDAEDVLQHVPLPMLAIGPSAVLPAAVRSLVVVADEHTPLDPPLDLAATWSASLGAVEVAIAHLEAPTTWPLPPRDDDHHGRARAALAARGISGAVQRVPTVQQPWEAIRDLEAAGRATVPVVTSRRWPGSDHWFATARTVIRQAGSPVLIVPY